MMKKIAAIPLILLSSLGCSKDDLPNFYALGNLRVLALKADTPEVTVGSSVTLTVLVSDLDRGRSQGGTLTLSYTLEACLDPGVGYGATPSCAADSTRPSAVTGTFTLSSPTYTGTAVLSAITVPATTLVGHSTQDQFNGVAYLALLTITSGTDTVVTFKRLLASTRTTKNSNPTLSAIVKDGTSISSLPSVESELFPSIPSGTAESYQVQLADSSYESRLEKITVSWFVSEGDMKYSRTESSSSNTYKPNSSPTKSVFMVPVIRDDRGGENFLSTPVIGP